MRILGIDPGLQVCGYACIETASSKINLIEAGVLRITSKAVIESRLNRIADDIDSLLDRFKPEVVSVEQLYSHYAHPRTAILMGHARGVILQRCAAADIVVKSYGATRIKKCITGSGHATKEQMQKTIQMILKLKELPRPADVADAVAAALCCAEMTKKPPAMQKVK